MSNDKDLSKLLNKPSSPDNLKAILNKNWQEQQKAESNHSYIHWKSLSAIAASVLVVTFIWLSPLSIEKTPQIIHSAFNDIALENKHSHGVGVSLSNIMSEFEINPPPDFAVVKMTKHCTLDDKGTVHLELTGNSKDLHIFMSKNKFEISAWQENIGETNNMQWKIIHPRNDLSVLIIANATFKSEHISQLTEKMFM